jgi:pimeloyl-ACP methyl ester carboxylesterase
MEMNTMKIKVILACTMFFIGTFFRLFSQDNPFPMEQELVNARAGDLILKSGSYHERKAEFGVLIVPENREKPESRLLHLPVIRLLATDSNPIEPVFFLQGGPGASCLSADMPDWIHKEHDFVMVGYRGVDGPVKLEIPELAAVLKNQRPLSPENLKAMGNATCAGLARLKQQGIDLDHYSMVDVVDDIEAARMAFGYKKINLWSHSYGTQVAYVYCIRKPESLYRNMVTGASAPGRMAVWEPEMVDAQLRYYADLWSKDPDCVKRSVDLIQTIRTVLKTLPVTWKTIFIDPDKVRLTMYQMLFNTGTAAQVFDAFVSAEKNDYNGLAFLSLSFDEGLQHLLNSGDFALKILTSGDIDITRDWENDMDPPGSIIGSPMSKLNWGPLKYCHFPIKTIAREYRNSQTAVRTLVVNGHPDFSSPLEYTQKELMPLLLNGTLIVKSEMGHQDIIGMQGEAYRHLWETFFRTGQVDDSKFQYAPMNFKAAKSLGSIFDEWFKSQPTKGQ